MAGTDRDQLRPGETDLVGQWLDTSSRIEGDAVCARIEWLIAERLERVAAASSGWDVLYRDRRDGRLWELTYPHSGMHGGGPPRLTAVAPDRVAAKYGAGTG
jgi:immunity protein 27 of polymorphic toxin system